MPIAAYTVHVQGMVASMISTEQSSHPEEQQTEHEQQRGAWHC